MTNTEQSRREHKCIMSVGIVLIGISIIGPFALHFGYADTIDSSKFALIAVMGGQLLLITLLNQWPIEIRGLFVPIAISVLAGGSIASIFFESVIFTIMPALSIGLVAVWGTILYKKKHTQKKYVILASWVVVCIAIISGINIATQ